VADANGIRVADVGHRNVDGPDPEHSDIKSGVPANDGRGRRLAIRARDGEVVVGLHRVVGGDDQTGAPMDPGRRDAGSPMHGKHRLTGLLHSGRELV
jgi:hypothetical protein